MTRLFGQKCLLDTNVLVYALDQLSPYFRQASHLIAHCTSGRVAGHLAQQNLLELLHVLTAYQRVPFGQAIADVQAFAQHPRLTVIAPAPQTLRRFLQLAQQASSSQVDVFDLYLVATMRDNGLTTLVTANVRDFQAIASSAGIEVIDLATLTV